ncbi:S8 family peptidase [Gimesia sp.]|uniref:S8 family peptidase n=1 Tax=Gimesia sp. TaxID=2024833 RepID=UPI000C364319|nr:S8 family peptidase [Gimesia sp.]MAX37523.1 serine protease [Gimesia sp.]|tara:strand:+ start:2879 stop:5371 length:2493 start_codon:yes stop_codon:yes gene_type:complete
MAKFRHFTIRGTTKSSPYLSTGGGPKDFKLPPRDNPIEHAKSLLSQLHEAETQTQEAVKLAQSKPDGITLSFWSAPGFSVWIEQFENLSSGIELLNVTTEGDSEIATVFIPDKSIGHFDRLLNEYLQFPDIATPKGNRKNRRFADSVSQIRASAVREFWTDHEHLLPKSGVPIWWEVWVRTGKSDNTIDDAFSKFLVAAAYTKIKLGQQVVHFPERTVVLAYCTLEDWADSLELLSHIAELRRAKEIPTDYVELQARDQIEFINSFRERIIPPPENAPSVCLLDTGVNREHPLLELALDESDWKSVNPNWTPADIHPEQHGTAMAGLSLYGCLTAYLNGTDSLSLTHRLESVKIFSSIPHEPENYGAVTIDAIARVEIEAPSRKRVVCLTILADGRDGGRPSAWSGTIDQICSGALDEDREHRLVIVAAGNLSREARLDYPNGNLTSFAIHDPAQAWNALTVGACTEKVHIHSQTYHGWKPLAKKPGTLSPCSTTSMTWDWKGSPVKPDIVLEGGNSAIDPSEGHVETIDDLALLTTTLDRSGRLLTTTGETSAATAQAARFGAIIQSHYPNFWPETIRGLIVHSARWTPQMLEEFPPQERESRLKCYGYGVPDLDRAIYSTESVAHMVVQSSLQPFRKKGNEIHPNEMHLHPLPWPRDVLEKLAEYPVTLRITLSYFIEPSPGRRGWGRRFRYQSHGLRFDVKRPTDGDTEFVRRINRAAWEDSEQRPKSSRESRRWTLGNNLRTRGSIHSDSWVGTGAELANCGLIGIYPITGWWKERAHLNCWDRQARYALIISLETQPENTLFPIDTNLYSAIENIVKIQPEIEIW